MSNKIDRLENKIYFMKNFIDTLGDSRDWEHNGNVIELPRAEGRCVCGHQIKYLYEIEHKSKGIRNLGSECINHFKDYNPELYNALVRSRDNLKEKKKLEKLLPVMEESKELEKEFERYRIIFRNRRINSSKHYWEDYEIRKILDSKVTHKTPTGRRNWLKRNLELIKNHVETFEINEEKNYKERSLLDNLMGRYDRLSKEKFFNQTFGARFGYQYYNNIAELDGLEDFLNDYENGKIKEVYSYSAFGKTYPIKELLKEFGFRWDGSVWGIDFSENPDLIEKIGEHKDVKIERWIYKRETI